jgi:hypothetical protein
MTRLIPLTQLPRSVRAAERAARSSFESQAAALAAATYKLVVAPGCHSGPYFDPPVIGWTCTRAGAEAYAAQLTYMPDGNHHRRAALEIVL